MEHAAPARITPAAGLTAKEAFIPEGTQLVTREAGAQSPTTVGKAACSKLRQQARAFTRFATCFAQNIMLIHVTAAIPRTIPVKSGGSIAR
eukprot:3158024-Amphidinium_carterae.1